MIDRISEALVQFDESIVKHRFKIYTFIAVCLGIMVVWTIAKYT